MVTQQKGKRRRTVASCQGPLITPDQSTANNKIMQVPMRAVGVGSHNCDSGKKMNEPVL